MALEIIIIGAGAAGLMAARELSAAGYSVQLLEAASAAGGRMHTLPEGDGFSRPVEGGAEFIHGKLELSLALAKEAGITVLPVRSEMHRISAGNWAGSPMEADGWNFLMAKMNSLTQDEPIASFLAREFPGEAYLELRSSVKSFAEGYDLADLTRASTKALFKEWSQEGEEEEYRLEGGYGRLTQFLLAECEAKGCRIRVSAPVTGVRWQAGRVEVSAIEEGLATRYLGDRLIVTVPLGILQSDEIVFSPAIKQYHQAAMQLGYGSVIKILLEFKTSFWQEKKNEGRTLFLVSDESVPTWWTQTDQASTVLTGWLTGDKMHLFRKRTSESRLEACLAAVASIFSLSYSFVKSQLIGHRIFDWSEAPFIKGGYSFEAIGGVEARSMLSQPVEKTIYFAGEALYEGNAPSTVEAALYTGRLAAKKIIAQP